MGIPRRTVSANHGAGRYGRQPAHRSPGCLRLAELPGDRSQPSPDPLPLRIAEIPSVSRRDGCRRGDSGGMETATARILVVEDDPSLAEVVGRYLSREGFDVTCAADGASGLSQALATLPDLVVLDLMLPHIDGLEVCRRLRAVAPIPVVMLTARGGEEDRIEGLELGADDYVAKPFSPRELTARVKAVLRRATAGVGSLATSPGRLGPLRAGPIEVDLVSHEARALGRELDALVRLVGDEVELAELADHARRRGGGDAHALGDRGRGDGAWAERLEGVDGLRVVLDGGGDLWVTHRHDSHYGMPKS